MKRITVTDSNIFIDLFKSDLIEQFFQLDFDVMTSHSVLEELYDDQRDFLLKMVSDKRLNLQSIQEENTALEFSRKLSDVDRTLLQISFELKAILLSGESLMRSWCRKREIEVHGILWILDQMVEYDVLDSQWAVVKLQYIRTINLWLPREECDRIIEKWNNQK